MSSIVQRGAVAAVAAAGTLAGLGGIAQAQTVKGIVVHHNRNAHSFVVADRTGRLYAIHASRAPRIGSDILVAAKPLHDGTYRLQHEHGAGRAARHVRVRGTVSWVDRRAGEFTISAPGVSLLVVKADRSAPVGTDVVATGTIDGKGELEDPSVQDVGQSPDGVDLEGTVLAVDAAAQTITVSADDEDASGASVVVTVPATFDLTRYAPGEEVELLVQPTGSGTATLLGSADDETAQTADDQGDDQGENPGSDAGGEDAGPPAPTTASNSGAGDD